MKVVYADGTSAIIDNNPFHRLFLSETCLNDACYSCSKTAGTHVADLTVGDLWGGKLSEEENRLGVSGLICHTEIGKAALEELGNDLYRSPINSSVVEHANKGMKVKKRRCPKCRKQVLSALHSECASSVCSHYLLPFCTPRYLLFMLGEREIFSPDIFLHILHRMQREFQKMLSLLKRKKCIK